MTSSQLRGSARNSRSGNFRAQITIFFADTIARPLNQFDLKAAAVLRPINSGVSARVIRSFDVLGSPRVFPLTAILIAGWCWIRNQHLYAVIVLAAAALTSQSIRWLKCRVYRVRPALAAFTDHTSSFPSGHSIAAVSVYGTGLVILGRIYPSIKLHLLLIAVIIVVMTGISRIARENHWATDVIAGYVIGGAIFSAALFAINRF